MNVASFLAIFAIMGRQTIDVVHKSRNAQVPLFHHVLQTLSATPCISRTILNDGNPSLACRIGDRR